MNTYAQIVSNTAMNVCFGDTQDVALASAFQASFVQSEESANPPRPWQQVPSGTQSGWTTADGGQTFTAPAAPAPKAKGMSGKEFTTYCAGVLATVNGISAAAGLIRFGQIIASMKASTDPLTSLATFTFQAALVVGGVFALSDATTLFAAIVANGAPNTMTQTEATALVAKWPMSQA